MNNKKFININIVPKYEQGVFARNTVMAITYLAISMVVLYLFALVPYIDSVHALNDAKYNTSTLAVLQTESTNLDVEKISSKDLEYLNGIVIINDSEIPLDEWINLLEDSIPSGATLRSIAYSLTSKTISLSVSVDTDDTLLKLVETIESIEWIEDAKFGVAGPGSNSISITFRGNTNEE